MIGLSIKDATDKASNETFKNITNSFSMEINRSTNPGTPRGGGNVRGQDIKKISEMDEIGYEDYFYGDGVCLIEWASRIEELIPKSAVHIRIEKELAKGFEYRRVVVEE